MANGRDTSRDGFRNKAETVALTNMGPLWRLAQRIPRVESFVNAMVVNQATKKMPYRQNPFSTMADYTSWASLTDKVFSGRHLPPAPPVADLPDIEKVADLFIRQNGEFIEDTKSTVCFAYFAQWFTDGFLRSDRADPPDPRKNSSNHEIDLMQIYGLHREVTDQLRLHEGGQLKFQTINGEEYPPYAYDETGAKKAEFSKVPDIPSKLRPNFAPEELARFFAVGSDTANLQLGFVMMNVLFFREHNRVARELHAAYPEWDDDRIFETARNVMIVLLIKIVVEEYINNISPYLFRLKANPTSFKNPPWYRPNWIAVEFNLVYRWHPLVPPTFRVAGNDVSVHETLYQTKMLTDHGLGQLLEDASNQPAGRVGLYNTDPDLRAVQVWSIEKGRDLNLRPYNDYRELCGYPRATAFNQISGDPRVQQALEELYGTVDRIEYYTGLYAEDLGSKSMLPSLIGRLVGIDAFSQAFTNPLLSPRIFNPSTFSEVGWKVIQDTNTISDMLHRNLPESSKRWFVSMTRKDWKRE